VDESAYSSQNNILARCNDLWLQRATGSSSGEALRPRDDKVGGRNEMRPDSAYRARFAAIWRANCRIRIINVTRFASVLSLRACTAGRIA
jgi:hypothetical protein